MEGLQDALGLHLLVLAGGEGARFQPIENSAFLRSNELTHTLFFPVSAPQGLQEAYGLHLLVSSPSGMGAGTN